MDVSITFRNLNLIATWFIIHVPTHIFCIIPHESMAYKTCLLRTCGKTWRIIFNIPLIARNHFHSLKIASEKPLSKSTLNVWDLNEHCGTKNSIIKLKLYCGRKSNRIEKCAAYANSNQILNANIIFSKAKKNDDIDNHMNARADFPFLELELVLNKMI